MAPSGAQLENPVTGERIVFRRTAEETNGELLEMDHFWTRPDHQTPAHIHPGMEERWEVLEGTVGFRIDGVEQVAGPGDMVVATPGVIHASWNMGDGRAHLRIQMRPALRWQEFVERLFTLAEVGRVQPDRGNVAALMSDFREEIALPS